MTGSDLEGVPCSLRPISGCCRPVPVCLICHPHCPTLCPQIIRICQPMLRTTSLGSPCCTRFFVKVGDPQQLVTTLLHDAQTLEQAFSSDHEPISLYLNFYSPVYHMSLASSMLSLSCPGFIHLCSFPQNVFYGHEGTTKAFWLVPLGIACTVTFNATRDAPYHNKSLCIAGQLKVKPTPLQGIV